MPSAEITSFKSLYRKRANTPCSWSRLAHRASDTTLGLPGTNPEVEPDTCRFADPEVKYRERVYQS